MIYIDNDIVSKLSKFADDTKLFNRVSTAEHVKLLQSDLNNLYNWSNEWQMLFNIDKCKVMHFGNNNLHAVYTLGGKVLQVVEEERDLGVIVQDDLKVSKQCAKAVTTANKVLGMISRSFSNRSAKVIVQFYKSLVCPHLEYCIQAWSPYLEKDKKLLEKVQRRATRMVDGLKQKDYPQRLKALHLTTLETRRIRGDLIQLFKMFNGFDSTNLDSYIIRCGNNLRGHALKLFKHGSCTNIGKYCFSNRVVDTWNSLPELVVACQSVNSFKNKLDKHLSTNMGLI